ncbi:VOC family protein [Phenylobacterium sp.]|uniref:VOC family protein n=1 Tax=Phenylobacterium sp. TaxID=1871053 RepID=UPI00272F9661|nr:VOC family protein [Phenylobacterium sp.]MDP1600867.1 VOC family protein [Phenylobacterium sp.]MDP3591077.1 VOC family protein [Phenylobacterium sp.]
MRFTDRYPIIVTPKLTACRAFWVARLGFEVVFEADWFVLLQADGASLAFMSPDHPSAPPGPEPFSGKGMCFELQVEDAAAAFDACAAAGLKADYPLTREAFGQLRFGFFDPSGLWVDIVEQVDPAAGFWDRYMGAAEG